MNHRSARLLPAVFAVSSRLSARRHPPTPTYGTSCGNWTPAACPRRTGTQHRRRGRRLRHRHRYRRLAPGPGTVGMKWRGRRVRAWRLAGIARLRIRETGGGPIPRTGFTDGVGWPVGATVAVASHPPQLIVSGRNRRPACNISAVRPRRAGHRDPLLDVTFERGAPRSGWVSRATVFVAANRGSALTGPGCCDTRADRGGFRV
jgi:hypothetical protein